MANKIASLGYSWLRWVWITERYMRRMPLLPRSSWFNVYLHIYTGPDWRGEGPHDHPWDSLSIRLWGTRLSEYRLDTNTFTQSLHNLPRCVFRKATDTHAIADGDWPVVTLFITGRRVRDWGFWKDGIWTPADEVIRKRSQKEGEVSYERDSTS